MNLDDDDTVDELPPLPRRDIPAADRELLVLAARALGAVQVEDIDSEDWLRLHFADGAVIHAWNPLAFSGDALELAVQLRFDVLVQGTVVGTDFDQPAAMIHDLDDRVTIERHGVDPLAAIRRAITRAAAEIGKQRSS